MSTEITLEKGDRSISLPKVISFLWSLSSTKKWKIVITEWRKDRTDEQNHALWGVAYKTLQNATGNDKDDLHTYFCGEFWGWKECNIMGKKRLKPRRTTTTDESGRRDVISTLQLSEFYAFIQQRSAETVGVYVPDPDPLWFMNSQERAA